MPNLKKLKEYQATAPPITKPEVKPVFFRLAQEKEREALFSLLEKEKGITICDTLLSQLKDLIATRNPERKLSPAELDALTTAHLKGQDLDLYGVWIYYPWSGNLIHSLDEVEFVELRTNRNKNKLTGEEQEALAKKRVGVVGLSVGYASVFALALERGCGELRIADFDTLDLSNLNRIPTGIANLGVKKTVIAARAVAELDPFLKVTCFHEGVTKETMDSFLFEGGKLDLLVDLCDSLDIKVRIRYAGKANRIPVLMETTDRGLVDIERHDLDPNYPIFHGMAGTPDPDLLKTLTTKEKAPFIMQIAGMKTLSTRLKASFLEIEQSIKTWPQLGSGIFHGGGAVADTSRRILLGHISVSGRFYVDFEDLIAPSARKLPTRAAEPVPHGATTEDWDMRIAECDALRDPADPEREKLAPELVNDLVGAAVRAPSPGNLQPWKWVCRNDFLYLFLDKQRSGSFLDREAEASLLGLGAATENLVLAAHARRLEVETTLFEWPNPQSVLVRFHLTRSKRPTSEPHKVDDLVQWLDHRHTNRRHGRPEPIDPRWIEGMKKAVQSVSGAELQFLIDRRAIESYAHLVGESDRLRFFNEQTYQDVMAELRWTDEEARATADGLHVKTLELDETFEAALHLCRHREAIELLKEWNVGKGLGKLSRDTVSDSSAVGLITMPSASPHDIYLGGRAAERLWLTATSYQLAVQPITVLLYLFARLERGKGVGFDRQEKELLSELRRQYWSYFKKGAGTELFMFRLSMAEPASVRTLRRPLDDVLVRLAARSSPMPRKKAA